MNLIQSPFVLSHAISQPTTLVQKAHAMLSQWVEQQQQNNLPALLTSDRKYNTYGWMLMNALCSIPQQEDHLIYNMNPLPSEYSALIAQMHKHATEDNALRAPALEVFVQREGNETASRLLFVFIKEFTELVNIRQSLTLRQTLEMSSLVLVEFLDLSLTDVVLCLRNIKTGKYGQLFESFDFVKLGDYLRRYRNEKVAFREQQHLDRKHTQSSLWYDILQYGPEQYRQPEYRQTIERMIDIEKKGTQNKQIEQQGMDTQQMNTQEVNTQDVNAVPAPAKGQPDDRPQIGVDVDALLAQASKPKPALKRAKPLTEWEVQQQIKADLTPHLDQMSEDDYSYFIHYYETYSQLELAGWLRLEQAKRHPQKKASSEGKGEKPDQEVA